MDLHSSLFLRLGKLLNKTFWGFQAVFIYFLLSTVAQAQEERCGTVRYNKDQDKMQFEQWLEAKIAQKRGWGLPSFRSRNCTDWRMPPIIPKPNTLECDFGIVPTLEVTNSGNNTISTLTVTLSLQGILTEERQFTPNLAVVASTTLAFSPLSLVLDEANVPYDLTFQITQVI